MRLLLVVLLLLSAMPPAWARGAKQVIFHTWPSGARVYVVVPGGTSDQPNGYTGRPFLLDLDQFKDLKGQRHAFNVRFELDGYEPRTETIPAFYFDSDHVREYPPGKPIRLTQSRFYSDFIYHAKDHPILSIGVGSVVFGVVGWGLVRWRRSGREAQWAHKLEGMTAAADDRDPLIRSRLGQYRIIDKIGQGGFATVYKAVPDTTLAEKDVVAIKVMNRELCKDTDYVARLKREFQICSKLDHPNIVRVIDWGEQEGLLYIVMELVRGTPLSAMQSDHGWPLAQTVKLLSPVADALAYAHTKGVIHRDMKPDNIMITDNGRPLIMDFGIARITEASTVTQTGSVLGTPGYVAPEAIRGNSREERSDQYSLGVMAYELLCGRKPFEEELPMSMLYKHVAEPPPSIREFRPDVSAEVDAVLQRMLAKDPGERYPDEPAAIAALTALSD